MHCINAAYTSFCIFIHGSWYGWLFSYCQHPSDHCQSTIHWLSFWFLESSIRLRQKLLLFTVHPAALCTSATPTKHSCSHLTPSSSRDHGFQASLLHRTMHRGKNRFLWKRSHFDIKVCFFAKRKALLIHAIAEISVLATRIHLSPTIKPLLGSIQTSISKRKHVY